MQVSWKPAATYGCQHFQVPKPESLWRAPVGPEHVQMGCGAFLRRLQPPVRHTG